MSFLNPYILVLLVPALFVALFAYNNHRKQLQLAGKLTLSSNHQYLHVIQLVLWFVGIISVVIGLARPVWGSEIRTFQTQNTAVMIAVDVSKSMDAQDVQPSRLERAKLIVTELAQQFSGYEMGLLVFAGMPQIMVPLTTDSISVVSRSRSISSNATNSQGTNIVTAIQQAVLSLQVASSSNRVLILLSDGEGHDTEFDTVLAELENQRIKVYSVGIGTLTGATIPVVNSDGSVSEKRDQNGATIISRLDEAFLVHISNLTGGDYVSVAESVNPIEKVTQSIKSYTSGTATTGIQRKAGERFDIFLAVAAIALGVAVIISDFGRAQLK